MHIALGSGGKVMAFAYKLIEDNDGLKIFENSTNQIIKTFKDNKEARKFLRHLNLGGGFDGWTPTFFLKEFELTLQSD